MPQQRCLIISCYLASRKHIMRSFIKGKEIGRCHHFIPRQHRVHCMMRKIMSMKRCNGK